jgi:hypothetical protein
MSLASSTNPIVSIVAGGRELQAADQGILFVGLTPTPGTGIITGGSVQAFTETTPYLVHFNAGPTVNVYPLYLKLNISVVGATNSPATWLTNTIDTGNRLSSGGTALTKANTNMNSLTASVSTVTVGAITATAASGSRRVVSHSKVHSLTVGVIHDSITINWGDSASTLTSALINNTSTTHSDTVINCAPIIIGPGQSMSLVHWAASQTTGTTYEVEYAWIEK